MLPHCGPQSTGPDLGHLDVTPLIGQFAVVSPGG